MGVLFNDMSTLSATFREIFRLIAITVFTALALIVASVALLLMFWGAPFVIASDIINSIFI